MICLLQEHQTPKTSIHAGLSGEYDSLQNGLLQLAMACWPSQELLRYWPGLAEYVHQPLGVTGSLHTLAR